MYDELYHYGIKGMKWGVRRYQDEKGNYTSAGKKRYIADKTAKLQRDIDSYKPIRNGLKDKKGRQILTKEDVSNSVNALKKQKAKKEEKLSRKWDISVTTQKLEREASIKDKLFYNPGTRKKAAKYVVDNNMTVEEATKKAKGDAWRNAAIFVAAYGALAVASTAYQLKRG